MESVIVAVVAIAQMYAIPVVSCDGKPVRYSMSVKQAFDALDACETDTECEAAGARLNDMNVCGW